MFIKSLTIPNNIKIKFKNYKNINYYNLYFYNEINENQFIKINKNININLKKNKLYIKSNNKSLNNTYYSNILNILNGLQKGFIRYLKLIGNDYRLNLVNNNINLDIGYSHWIKFKVPNNIKIELKKKNLIRFYSYDYLLLNKIVTFLKYLKKTEPYKGKGFQFLNEKVNLKLKKKKNVKKSK